MSGLDEDHHKDRPPSWRRKPRKSMDMEFHDLDLDSVDDELEYQRLIASGSIKHVSGNSLKNGEKLRNSGIDDDDDGTSDEDTFGEASNDCKPDQQYLDELLEDYHPERINLLDHNIPPRISMSDDGNDDDDDDDESYLRKTGRSNGLLSPSRRNGTEFSSNHSLSSSSHSYEDENDCPPSWSSSRLGSDAPRQQDDDGYEDVATTEVEGANDIENGNAPQSVSKLDVDDYHDKEVQCGITEDSSVPEESEEGEEDLHESIDKVVGFSTESPERPRRRLKDQLESMGIADKKSFRQVSKTTFWAQPFKGLGQGLGRPKRRGIQATVEEQEATS
jgi:hypothetical protein